MKSLLFLILTATVMGSSVTIAGTREQMPGKTQKEREIRWIWKILKEVTLSCMNSTTDCKDPDLRAVVQQLNADLPLPEETQARNWNNILQFVSETDNPGMFQPTACEVHRLAVTQMTKDATTYINTDRMQLSTVEWVGILVHESVHHLGYDDDEKRLPDRVGAMVAQHFQNQWSETGLDEFFHPEARVGIFNSSTPMRTAATFFSFSLVTADLDMSDTNYAPVCGGGQVVKSEFVSSPLWLVKHMQVPTGVVSMWASASIVTHCLNQSTNQETISTKPFIVGLDLQFPAALNIQGSWWTQTSNIDPASLLAGVYDSPAGLVDTNRTFIVLSVQNQKPTLNAGDSWHTQIVVKSLDGYSPSGCEMYMSASHWSYQRYMNLPAVVDFQNCHLTNLGSGQWQLDADTTLPANSQPDYFYVPLIRFPDPTADRFAVPSKPVFVNVQNATAAKPMVLTAYRVLGLQPVNAWSGLPIVDSFQATTGQMFWVEVDTQGPQQVGMEFLDFNLLVSYQGQVYLSPYSGRIDMLGDIIKSSQSVLIPGGTRRRYQMVMPAQAKGFNIIGYQLNRFYMQTSDYSWAELSNSVINHAIILNSQVPAP